MTSLTNQESMYEESWSLEKVVSPPALSSFEGEGIIKIKFAWSEHEVHVREGWAGGQARLAQNKGDALENTEKKINEIKAELT